MNAATWLNGSSTGPHVGSAGAGSSTYLLGGDSTSSGALRSLSGNPCVGLLSHTCDLLEPPSQPVIRACDGLLAPGGCYFPDHGHQLCLRLNDAYPTVDEAWNETASLEVINTLNGRAGLVLPDLCPNQSELVRMAWRLTANNEDVLDWILSMLGCTYPELADIVPGVMARLGSRLDGGAPTVVILEGADTGDNCAVAETKAVPGLVATSAERLLIGTDSPFLYNPWPNSMEFNSGFDPETAVLTINRGTCHNGAFDQRQRHWDSVFAAYAWGTESEKACAVLTVADSLIHELMHILGLYDVNGRAYWVDDSPSLGSEDHGGGAYCDYYYQLGNTFKWAMAKRYPDLLADGCCGGNGDVSKFMNICNSHPLTTGCLQSFAGQSGNLIFGECGDPLDLPAQPVDAPDFLNGGR